ncbi:hypothetical protein KEM55_001379, partial [Ascosphaera atra]
MASRASDDADPASAPNASASARQLITTTTTEEEASSIICPHCELPVTPKRDELSLPLSQVLEAHIRNKHPDVDGQDQDQDQDSRQHSPDQQTLAVSPSRLAAAEDEEDEENEEGVEDLDTKTTVSLADAEDRVPPYCTFNDVNDFTHDYEDEIHNLSEVWNDAFQNFDRPQPYERPSSPSRQFLPITRPEIFADMLRDPDSLSTDKIYALTANSAHALKTWQDEWLQIDATLRLATHTCYRKNADPRKLEDPR